MPDAKQDKPENKPHVVTAEKPPDAPKAEAKPQPSPATQATQDNRPVAPPPDASTTQKPNPTPAVNKPATPILKNTLASAAKPEPLSKTGPATAPQPVWTPGVRVDAGNVDSIIHVENVGGNLPFRGVCKKCGWQTHQPSDEAARQAVSSHAGRHIREAAA
jgi:hypothetical protein